MFVISLAYDVSALRWGKEWYWSGSLVVGGLIDPDDVHKPEDWWDRRVRMLRRNHDRFGDHLD